MANPYDQFDPASAVKDIGVSFSVGANQLLKMAGDAYGFLGGEMDNILSRQGRENIEYLQRKKSPQLREAEANRKAATDAKDSTLGQAAAYLKETFSDPLLAASLSFEALPSLVASGGAGAVGKGVASKLLAKSAETATKIGVGTAVATGASLQGLGVAGDQYEQLVDTLEKMPEETAMQVPQLRQLMESEGLSLGQAKAALAMDLARSTGVLAAIASAGTQLVPGGTTIERAFVGETGKAATKKLLSRGLGVVKGAVGESVQESAEGASGRMLTNLLATPVEPERPLMQGVGEEIGAAIGGVGPVGGISGAMHGGTTTSPRPVSEGEAPAGMSGQPPMPAATKPSLAPQQEASLERSEEMTPEQFFATVNIRQARLLGGEPNAEDVALVGEVPPPRNVVSLETMNGALDEAYNALNAWKRDNPNAPENIVLIFDPEMTHNGYGIQGAFDPKNGAIFINTAFTPPERLGQIVSHEWAHATLATPEGQKAFADFALREIPQADLDALATRYGTQDRMVLLEEWIAENQEKAPGVISRIVARIREWLANFGIVNLNDGEVADIMLRTLREQAEGRVQPDVDPTAGGVEIDPNSEAYEGFIGGKLDTAPKYALQKLPAAGDVVDAKGNLKYTIPQKTLNVSHYSRIPGLTVIDPAFYSTGAGKHYHRMMKGINKSFFFVGNSKPAAYENVSGKGMTRYQTKIDSSRIYDMNEDPLDLWFAPNPQKSEGLLKELGYDGFLATTDDNRSFVAMFYPTDVETGQMTREAAPVEEELPEAPQESAEDYIARVEAEEAEARRKALRRASRGKYSLAKEPERISGIMASPSVTDIQYDRAKKNLNSADQARFKSQITDYAPDADIFDAVGDWVDGAENSVAAIFRDSKPVEDLQRLAARAGLAGDQKAVLWWRTSPEGTDAIHEIVWPKNVSMDDARQAMIDVGLENRTLIQTPDGIRGFVFDQGRQNVNKIEKLHEHETGPSLDSSPASGDFLGSWTSRAEGRRAYRRVLGSTPQTEARAGELRSGEVGTGGEPETRFSLAQTRTPEFKKWFGDSQIVDADGNPQVMYHGTFNRLTRTGPWDLSRAEDFTVFRPRVQAAGENLENEPGVIFASPNPQLASEFSGVTPSMLQEGSGDTIAEKRPGARVYPVYVKAENPFDYENPRHIQQLFGDEDYIELIPGSEEGGPYGSLDYDGVTVDRSKVESGDWADIEYLLGRIKNEGFDGAFVSERNSEGEKAKNIAVFNSTQIKSATGNVGAFGQRPLTAEERKRLGVTEEEAAEGQKRGDIRMSLTGKPLGKIALEDAEKFRFKNQKEVSKYLGELLKKDAPQGLDDRTPETRRALAELMDRELSLALTMPKNADAIGWYSREMDKVFEILRSPELDYQLDDPLNRGVFYALLAITSNGQKVVPQFLKAAELYEGWRKTGKIPPVGKWGGERSRAIKGHAKFLNQMLEAVGPEQTLGFLTSDQSLGDHLDNLYGMVAEAQGLPEKATVKEKKAAIRKHLNAKMPGGELVDYNTVGAIVFGPKLGGGFFANLYGKFDRLTMDRWFMRTFHRLTGRLGEDRPEMVQSIIKEARMEAADVLPEDISDEEILQEITTTGKQAFKDYKEIKRRLKQDPNDSEAYGLDVMRRLYNRYLKAKSGLYDAPDNGSHRKFIREVMEEVQKLRAERGEEKIDTSDIQASLWYLEKNIWDDLRKSMDEDAITEADSQQDEDEGEDEDTAGRVSYSDGARELYRRKTRKKYDDGDEKPKERVLAGA